MRGIHVSGLYVYPIKSCGGFAVGEWGAGATGFRHDRRWMLVDEDGVFLSQRRLPRMALVRTSIKDDRLAATAPGMPPLELPLHPDGPRTLASVWGDTVEVTRMGADADGWFSEFLGVACRLVHMPHDSVRLVDPQFARAGDRTGLSDGFPFLLISEASLDDLNTRLETPLPMDRFRPNLVVGGCEPYAEDGWRRLRIGEVEFRVVKPCSRCVITTTDQETAETGKEPLRTLAKYRRVGGKVLFGQNLIPDNRGTLRIGDPLEVLE
jgi:uncharacterized protein YcbX